MSTKNEIIKYRNKCFKDSNDLSLLQFDSTISREKGIQIKEQQDKMFKKFTFLKGLSKAYDKNKELKEKQVDEQRQETEFEDCFICQNCREMYPLENMGTSELARQDQICEFCMENGYGK